MSWWSRKVTHSSSVMKWLAWTFVAIVAILLIVLTIITAGAASAAAGAAAAAFNTVITATGSSALGITLAVVAGSAAFALSFISTLAGFWAAHFWATLLFCAALNGSVVAAAYCTKQHYIILQRIRTAEATALLSEAERLAEDSDSLLIAQVDSTNATNWPSEPVLPLLLADPTQSFPDENDLVLAGYIPNRKMQ